MQNCIFTATLKEMADMCNCNVCILWHFLGKLTYLVRPHYFLSSWRSLMITNSNLCIRQRQGINFCQASKSSIPLSSFEAAWFPRRRSVFGPQMSWWSGHHPQLLCNIAHTNHWSKLYSSKNVAKPLWGSFCVLQNWIFHRFFQVSLDSFCVLWLCFVYILESFLRPGMIIRQILTKNATLLKQSLLDLYRNFAVPQK